MLSLAYQKTAFLLSVFPVICFTFADEKAKIIFTLYNLEII